MLVSRAGRRPAPSTPANAMYVSKASALNPRSALVPHRLVRQLQAKPQQKLPKHQAQRWGFGPFDLQQKD
ncbi:MAG TPA: hypothetical protein VGD90_09025 [Sphingobacteriaceae bacterium]